MEAKLKRVYHEGQLARATSRDPIDEELAAAAGRQRAWYQLHGTNGTAHALKSGQAHGDAQHGAHKNRSLVATEAAAAEAADANMAALLQEEADKCGLPNTALDCVSASTKLQLLLCKVLDSVSECNWVAWRLLVRQDKALLKEERCQAVADYGIFRCLQAQVG